MCLPSVMHAFRLNEIGLVWSFTWEGTLADNRTKNRNKINK